LATYLQIPVYTTFMGKGVMSEKDDLYLGVAGCSGDYPAAEAARNADLILAIGARFADLHCASWLPGYTYNIPPTQLVQVDIDASEIGRNYPCELGIIADAKAFLGQMLEMAKAKGLKREGQAWAKEVYEYKTDWTITSSTFSWMRISRWLSAPRRWPR
jgi:acetolactate synthase-1/2/3 large subunit